VTEEGALKYFLPCDKDGSDTIDFDELAEFIVIANEKTGDDGLAGADTAKCVASVNQIRMAYMETHTDEVGLPKHLQDWCISLSSSVAIQNPDGRHASLVWKEGCEEGRQELEDNGFDPKRFCLGMSAALRRHADDGDKHQEIVWMFKGPNGATTPYAPLVATASCDLSYLKEPRPCCKAHGFQGCHDKIIEHCVCDVDSHCCEVEWDLRCSELVEKIRIKDEHQVYRCGRCPVPLDDAAALKNCLGNGCE